MTLQPSSNKLSLLAALFFLAGVTALAQTPGMQPGAPTSNQPTPGQPTPGQATPGQASPNASFPDAAAPGTPAAYADQMFITDTFKDDQLQIQMSQLAQQKSSSDDVKLFSQSMVKVHNELDDQLKPLARQFAISETQKPTRKEKEELARLEALSGPDFDAAYLQAMAITQQHTLKEFKDEAAAAQNPALQNAARMDEPTLAQNFGILQKLAQAHNIQLASK